MNISLILDWTVRVLRRGLRRNAAEDVEGRHGRDVETEEENEMVVLERNGGEAISDFGECERMEGVFSVDVKSGKKRKR